MKKVSDSSFPLEMQSWFTVTWSCLENQNEREKLFQLFKFYSLFISVEWTNELLIIAPSHSIIDFVQQQKNDWRDEHQQKNELLMDWYVLIEPE